MNMCHKYVLHIAYNLHANMKKTVFFRSWPELNAFYFQSCIGLFSSSQYRHVKLWNAYRKYTVSLPTVWWITICNCSASANHTSTVQSLIIHGCQNAFIPVWNNTICHIFRLWKALKQHRQSIVVHVCVSVSTVYSQLDERGTRQMLAIHHACCTRKAVWQRKKS